MTEIAAPVLLEVLADFGLGRVLQIPGTRGTAVQLIALGAIGLCSGGISLLVRSTALIAAPPMIHAAVLLAISIGAGVMMHRVGAARVKRGKTRTAVVSFWGGAIVVFCYGLVRFCAQQV
jgi:hypothetical protein